MQKLILFLMAYLCAQSVVAFESQSKNGLIEAIESTFSNTAEASIIRSQLRECELEIINAYPRNCSMHDKSSQQSSKIAKTVWTIDLSTVERVRISPVHGDMHVGFWPSKKNFLSAVMGLPVRVRQSKTMYHCDGDAFKQDVHISAGVVVSKKTEPKLAQLLSEYIKSYCK
ncbi:MULTISPECIES: hypothetical protein [Halocynthiibacter]|uniref:DUF4468 domain-containing protein n=1 Tax=Halocynthiibacter halioticoli TaxID=2986804 RepID=A0AAE3J2S1_9RHOB|nr:MULTISPECIES: hypothetical protein [Halocynthiibacter]MCV6825786.1 hypothetical protein [Halocynthiibacter halioticoli]MCW4058787.1 hypothetical protein [Halocynthiibacter sp. SDUM655004]